MNNELKNTNHVTIEKMKLLFILQMLSVHLNRPIEAHELNGISIEIVDGRERVLFYNMPVGTIELQKYEVGEIKTAWEFKFF
jgi:hypothetical protein